MSEPFDRAIDRVMEDRSPLEEVDQLDTEERKMLLMAQMLRGSRGSEVRSEFVEELHEKLFPAPIRISRRSAFLGGIGTLAAGLVAGLGIDRLFNHSSSPSHTAVGTPVKDYSPPLVGADGRWVAVAKVAEVPHGAVRPFDAGAVQGFLINDHGEMRALSRICTHMGCVLRFEKDEQALLCPCHGALFTLDGPQLQRSYNQYPLQLPPLPSIKVRKQGENVEVWTV